MNANSFKKCFVSVVVILSTLCFAFCPESYAQSGVRTEVKIPNISGYITLKCDFHMHTVFSDGKVWPTIRPDEAWREGLDAFAITDHLEYLPFKNDVRPNPNRSYELARPIAQALGLNIIRGAEITREMPPGHINAIFLEDANALATKEWRDAVKAAVQQNAFIFYNHPGWQQPEEKAVWHPEHTELHEKRWMHGMEIVNDDSYYPLAHQWAIEKRLTMLGSSDVHNPTNLDYDFYSGRHRAMTLVLAKEKTKEAIKEALLERRTVVYWRNTLIGEAEYLREIFKAAIEIVDPDVTIRGKGAANIQIRNRSEIDFELTADGAIGQISFPQDITLFGDKTVLLKISGASDSTAGKEKIRIPYRVKNLLTAPQQGLHAALVLDVNFIPTEKKKN